MPGISCINPRAPARLTALRILVDELGRGVNLAEHELTPEIFELARKLWGWTPDKKSG